MFKHIVVIILTLIFTNESYAFLDFIAKEAKDLALVVSYTDAASELLEQFNGTEESTVTLRAVQKESERFKSMFNETVYVGKEFQSLKDGPKWNTNSLEQDIRNTTNYVRRLNHFITRAAFLGSDWSAVLGIHEVNNGVQKLTSLQRQIFAQQTMRYMDKKSIEIKEKNNGKL